MTAGQWEQFEAPAAKAMEQFWAHLRGHTDEPDEIDFALANAVLNVVGPLIAEDTRDRLVAAAGNAVERQSVVDAGRLATWLRHEMAGAASQREVDAYDRVLRMVEGGGERDTEPWAATTVPCEACKLATGTQLIEVRDEQDRKYLFDADEAENVWRDRP